MFYYLGKDGNNTQKFCGEFLEVSNPQLNKWVKINIEKAPHLKEEIGSKADFVQLYSLFEKKIKKISLIDFFCNDEDHSELKIISTILKHMRDTKGLYITIV